jgi:ketosteroid isomerase-like protein
VDTAAAVQAVKDASAAALKAAQTLDANGMVSYYSDDATVMPPNAPAITDRASEQKAWAAMLVPGAKISWTPNKVESAASGEIVYEEGTYAVTVPGADGKWVDDKGKYLSVWKKQADGSWKEEEDMWSSDLPAVAAAPVKKGK